MDLHSRNVHLSLDKAEDTSNIRRPSRAVQPVRYNAQPVNYTGVRDPPKLLNGGLLARQAGAEAGWRCRVPARHGHERPRKQWAGPDGDILDNYPVIMVAYYKAIVIENTAGTLGDRVNYWVSYIESIIDNYADNNVADGIVLDQCTPPTSPQT